MNAATKLALRRFALRWLRKLVDVADDRLHAAEVTLRNDLVETQAPAQRAERPRVLRAPAANEIAIQTEPPSDGGAVVAGSPSVPYEAPNTYAQWEARRSGVATVAKKRRVHHRRSTAADFDFQIIRKREEFVQ